jgi:ABC-type branched-subunit amino acid transport system substrate-binding protein
MVATGLFLAACESPQNASPAQDSRPEATYDTGVPQAPPASLEVPANAPSADETAALPGPEEPPQPGMPSLVPYLTQPAPVGDDGRPLDSPPPPPRSSAVRVALLLPLTGANADLGKAMLNAAQLALFDFAGDGFELILHDTQGTPEGATEAASRAIGDGAAIILGPLLAKSVRAVAPAARAANVAVVAFSSDRSIAGDGIYTMGFFPGAEIERVVSFARSRGILRFAALVPENDYGMTVAEALRRSAEAVGAVVSRVQFFDPAATDYSDVVRDLANYASRRQTLEYQRNQLEGRQDEIARRALERLADLETIGDLPFDAVLLAAGGEPLRALAAHLPFYDIDPAKIRVLGTGQWDAAAPGAEPALIGGWFAAPPPAARAAFEQAYESVYGAAPPRLATLAYDATALAAVLARAQGGPDFSIAAVTAANGFAGRDGIFRFGADGLAQRGLAILEVGSRRTKVISAAPETFIPSTN